MFESEVELEKKASFGPLVLVAVLVIAIVGSLGYYLMETARGLPSDQAPSLVTGALRARGPVTLQFRTGLIEPNVSEKPDDPHYRLLQQAGILNRKPIKGGATEVSLTPEGEQLLSQIPGVQKTNKSDGTTVYVVPLAERHVIQVGKVTMRGPDLATVQYTWSWAPSKMGDLFDVSTPRLKAFSVWDRKALIEKYGADYYHADPATATIALVRADKSWKEASQ